jgi:uncharacterized paraquat-inducible protein A
MKFEMTRCNQCGCEMLTGVDVCPSCGKQQSVSRSSSLQPRTLLAVGLAAAVLLFFNWIKPAAPQASQIASPPSATLPSR